MAIFFEAFVPVPLSVADAPSEKAPVHKGRKDSEKKSRLWLTICWGGDTERFPHLKCPLR